MNSTKRIRENDSLHKNNPKTCKIDFLDSKINRLEKSNIRRARKIKTLEHNNHELEKQIEELNKKVNFLESVADDYASENNYFRSKYNMM